MAFTPAWVEKLVQELETNEGYAAVFGKELVPKPPPKAVVANA